MCQRLSSPLAAAGISVLYISTFETDYVLVEEKKLRQTVAVLRETYGEIEIEGEEGPEQAGVAGSLEIDELRDSSEMGIHSHPLFLLPLQLTLSRLTKDAVPSHAHTVLELFLGTGPRFLNFTITDEEISIVHPWGSFATAEEMDSGLQVGHEPWSCIQVGDHPLGFEECGIVSSQSRALSEAAVAIFYMCTFSFDFVLIATSDVSTAVPTLSKRFDVIEGDQVCMGSLASPSVAVAEQREEAQGGVLESELEAATCLDEAGEDSHHDSVVKIGGHGDAGPEYEAEYP